jgi:valyl-tRNA synthetase
VRVLAAKARDAVPGQTEFFPDTWLKTYYNWLDNIRDWCISRQIWWGHRIPAWTCAACGELVVSETDPPACPKCGGSLEQDPDVLDTWFSSALWPFSTMGWPEKTPDLENFYPTSVLVTAFDLLFFWVARMIMMGQHFMGQPPFRHVYIHALVRDAQGRKMSKTLGNGIDPMEMIGKYGADSLRFDLTAFAAMGRDIRMSEDRIEGYRHFINKLWNASRFALMNLDETPPPAADPAQADGLHHRWILHRLEEVKAETDAAISAYRFNDAAQSLYKFLWSEFCDWYLELIKGDMKEEGPGKQRAQHTLYTVLRELLLLLHPIIPFVTAQIWQALPGQQDSDIATLPGPPPRPACLRPDDADAMVFLQETISAIRTIRAELGINPSCRLTVLLRPADPGQAALLERGRAWLTSLARLENLAVRADGRAPKAAASNVVRGCEVIVHLSGAVDFQAELARLEKELGKTQKELAGLEAKLGNARFLDKAPEAVVRQERDRAADLADKRSKMLALQDRFRSALAEL